MNIRVNLNLLAIALLALCMSGCGIKPGSVAAPQGEDKDQFEHVYPDPATFPRGESH